MNPVCATCHHAQERNARWTGILVLWCDHRAATVARNGFCLNYLRAIGAEGDA